MVYTQIGDVIMRRLPAGENIPAGWTLLQSEEDTVVVWHLITDPSTPTTIYIPPMPAPDAPEAMPPGSGPVRPERGQNGGQ